MTVFPETHEMREASTASLIAVVAILIGSALGFTLATAPFVKLGPYSGKETLSLVVWLGAWVILHSALRKKDLDVSRWLIVFLLGVGIATTLIWPPVFEYLAGH